MNRLLDTLQRHVGVLVLVVVWLAIALLFPTRAPDAGSANSVGRAPVPSAVSTLDAP